MRRVMQRGEEDLELMNLIAKIVELLRNKREEASYAREQLPACCRERLGTVGGDSSVGQATSVQCIPIRNPVNRSMSSTMPNAHERTVRFLMDSANRYTALYALTG